MADPLETLREALAGLAIRPTSKDAHVGPYPCYLSPGWLRVDPTFDPIRKHPRFQRLVE
ncbi:hypothetical protein BH24GEM1_BH24GEM1_00980 [soil metagenome]|nr:hypothetical protein [Gemmatimonadales bacterium]